MIYIAYSWNFDRLYKGGVLLIVDPFGKDGGAQGGMPGEEA